MSETTRFPVNTPLLERVNSILAPFEFEIVASATGYLIHALPIPGSHCGYLGDERHRSLTAALDSLYPVVPGLRDAALRAGWE